MSGITTALDQPEFAAAIGLVKFGSLQNHRRGARPSFVSGIKGVFGKMLSRF